MLTFLRNLSRVFQVFSVLFRFIIIPLGLPWRRRDANGPLQVRTALETLGGAWIKLGQALALRFDIFPAEYCYELFKLLNEVKPFPYEDVRRIIKEDLEHYPEELFETFENEAFAAASIGQVHRATLPSGEKVAVKVQRPNVRQIIKADIQLMYMVARLLDYTRILGATRSRDIVEEFANWTADELNYLIEARHACNLDANASGDPLERNAKVYLELSSPRVLTMELIEGIPLIDIIYALRDKNVDYLNTLKEQGYDLPAIANHLTWNLLNQLYRFGYFHADLHPANLFVLPGNAIGYVDFGIVGNLSNEVRDSLAQYARFLYRGEIDQAVEEFMRWISPSDKTNVPVARVELIHIVDDYLFSLRDPDRKKGKDGSAVFEVTLLDAVRRHQMKLSSNIVTYLKALVTADAVIFELAPDFDLPKMENRFFGRLIQQDIRDFVKPANFTRFVYEYGYRVRRVFDSLESLRKSGQDVGDIVRRVRGNLQKLALLTVPVVAGLFLITSSATARQYIDKTGMRPNTLRYVLLFFLLVIFLLMIRQSRKLPTERAPVVRNAQEALRQRWEQPSSH
jgi:ubiquinone biosynthesis protein